MKLTDEQRQQQKKNFIVMQEVIKKHYYLLEAIAEIKIFNYSLLDNSVSYRLHGYVININSNGLITLYKEEYLKNNRNCNLIFILEASEEKEFLIKANKYDKRIFNY